MARQYGHGDPQAPPAVQCCSLRRTLATARIDFVSVDFSKRLKLSRLSFLLKGRARGKQGGKGKP